MSAGRLASLAALWLSFSAAAGGPATAHEVAPSRYTYRDDVRPLFLAHCGGCHRPGGPAPMSLLDYQEAVPWAKAIKLQILEGRMPPFLPDDESGPFLHRRGLSAEEIDVIVDWTVGAVPEGGSSTNDDEESIPAPRPRFSGATPDLVLEPRAGVVLDEDETRKTACLVLPTGLDRPRVLSRLELAPGAPTVLRRATVFRGDSCVGSEPLLTWLPDQQSVSFPAGLGGELPAAGTLAVELRYQKGWGQEGKRIADESALGLWFSVGAVPVASVRIEGATTLPAAVTLVGLFPELVSEGDAGAREPLPLRVEAVLPGGRTELLLEIGRPDPAWVETYFFRQPRTFPRGTELRSSGPSVWVELVSAASSTGSDDAKDEEH
jgi:mono/diheme cytochrome c family protein